MHAFNSVLRVILFLQPTLDPLASNTDCCSLCDVNVMQYYTAGSLLLLSADYSGTPTSSTADPSSSSSTPSAASTIIKSAATAEDAERISSSLAAVAAAQHQQQPAAVPPPTPSQEAAPAAVVAAEYHPDSELEQMCKKLGLKRDLTPAGLIAAANAAGLGAYSSSSGTPLPAQVRECHSGLSPCFVLALVLELSRL